MWLNWGHFDLCSVPLVTCLSFRDDGDECLVSGCQSGDLAIWDLNENRSRHVSHEVHPNGVSMATFIRGEPLLVSTGMQDNAVKVHIFDSAMGRVLRSRSGHLAPPTKIRFCGGDGRQMISAGLDREVRIVSTIRDAQNREMSQGALNKKRKKAKRQKVDTDSRAAVESVHRLSPVVDLAVGSARRGDEDFANVVTAHAGLYAVYTWQMDSGTLAKHVLTPPRKKEEGNEYRLSADVTATSVAISPTGHLCFVGYSDGAIHAYNLQSGRPQEAFNEQHNGRVTAIAVAALGETIVSSSDDLRLSFWDPQTRQKQGESIELEAAVEHLAWSAESDLIAVACTDYIVRNETPSIILRPLDRKPIGNRSETDFFVFFLFCFLLPFGSLLPALQEPQCRFCSSAKSRSVTTTTPVILNCSLTALLSVLPCFPTCSPLYRVLINPSVVRSERFVYTMPRLVSLHVV